MLCKPSHKIFYCDYKNVLYIVLMWAVINFTYGMKKDPIRNLHLIKCIYLKNCITFGKVNRCYLGIYTSRFAFFFLAS